jgi:hypothetical protein
MVPATTTKEASAGCATGTVAGRAAAIGSVIARRLDGDHE